MSHDAFHQSLSERIQSLGFAPDLREILAELAERTEQPAAEDDSGHSGEYQEMLDRARGPLRGGQHAKPHPHLRLITGGLAAIAAVAVAVARWVAKSGAHQAAATVVAAAMVGAASVPVGLALTPDTAPAGTSFAARHVHRDGHPAVNAPAMASPRTRRRRPDGHHQARDVDHGADPDPGPTPGPTGTPSPWPSPSQTSAPPATPTPTASPGPTASGGPSGHHPPVQFPARDLAAILSRDGPAGPWSNMLQHGKGAGHGVPTWQR